MISSDIKDFIQNENLGYSLATRSADLVPLIGRAFSASVGKDNKSITFFMPEVMSAKHIENMENNGQIALNLGAIPSHETYQIKGKYKGLRNCEQIEIEQVYGSLEKFGKGLLTMGFAPELLAGFQKFNIVPLVAIEFEVEEIFDQTPRPGAGNKIN